MIPGDCREVIVEEVIAEEVPGTGKLLSRGGKLLSPVAVTVQASGCPLLLSQCVPGLSLPADVTDDGP